MLDATDRWYCVETYPSAEKLAVWNLNCQHFVNFLPLKLELVKPDGETPETRWQLRPLFSGYLFVMFNITRGNWSAIRNTIGVKSILGYTAACPSPVPHGIVEGLRILAGDDDIIVEQRRFPKPQQEFSFAADQPKQRLFEKNDHVRIAQGPLAGPGMVGLVQSSSADRVKLLLSTLQGPRSITLPAAHLEPVLC